MKLYHYVHCPFCVRVRMALGFLDHEYESIVLPYDDEETPISLTSTKMLPIMNIKDQNINESLDIIKRLDDKNLLRLQRYEDSRLEIENLLGLIGKDVHSLAMPYWMWTPEFDLSSREYFQRKKEVKRGPFNELVKNKMVNIDSILDLLAILEKDLKPFYKDQDLSLADILIASHLWGLYIVPEFQFPAKIHSYLQLIAKLCNFNYHQDFWK